MAEVPKVDEFSFVLAAAVLFIFILGFAWTTPTESPPYVPQQTFELTVSPGERTSFDFTITGTPELTAVNLSASGEIKNWITFNKNNFDFVESTTVTTTLDIPENTSEGLYTGRVYVVGRGGKDSFSVNVRVEGREREIASRAVSLGDFTVSYSEGTDIVDSDGDIKIYKSYFSSRELNLGGLIPSSRLSIVTGGNIHLIIEDTNSISDLIVELNGEEIYKRRVDIGEVFIPIEKDKIKGSNLITIRVGSPGAMFWATSFYRIKLAEFNIDYKGAFAKTFNITLSKNEVDNFKQFNIFYRVTDYTYPLPLMMIKVNNQIVYWDTPPLVLFNKKLKEDMFGNPLYLQEGTNTITFMFEENAAYTVADAMLTIEYYE